MQCWVLNQSSIYYGDHTVWIAEEMMRVEHADIGMVAILHKVGDEWKLAIFNNRTREIYDGDLGVVPDEFGSEPFEKQTTRLEIGGVSAAEYTMSGEDHFWVAESISYPHSRGAYFVCYHFWTHIAFPEAILRRISGNGVEFDTYSCERADVPIERILERPSNFKNVGQVSDIIDGVAPGAIVASGPEPAFSTTGATEMKLTFRMFRPLVDDVKQACYDLLLRKIEHQPPPNWSDEMSEIISKLMELDRDSQKVAVNSGVEVNYLNRVQLYLWNDGSARADVPFVEPDSEEFKKLSDCLEIFDQHGFTIFDPFGGSWNKE